jgi:hypothetical protein
MHIKLLESRWMCGSRCSCFLMWSFLVQVQSVQEYLVGFEIRNQRQKRFSFVNMYL